MKKNKIILLLSLLALVILSCSTDDKFSGSPVGSQQIETLEGTISTPATAALTGQDIDFTASLPAGVTFNDTVKIEVTTLRSDGGRIRDYYELMPNQTTITDKIEAVGGLIFSTTFELSITGIFLQTTIPGKHYLMTSNKITLSTGNTSIPDTQDDRLKVFLTWYNNNPSNKMRLTIDKPGSLPDVNAPYNGGRLHSIVTTGSQNSTSLSSAFGEYIFKVGGDGVGTLSTEPVDLDYRLILVYPDGKAQVFDGTYNGMTSTSPVVPAIKVTKELVDGVTVFSAVQL
jgi:hypothetical protein